MNGSNHRIIVKAVNVMKAGGIIAYPTDTVYGLGTNAFDPKAVLKIFKIKNRPLSLPLSVAVSDYKMATRLAYVNSKAKQIINHFWPGAVTILLKKKALIPDIVTAGTDIIGLRAPDHVVPLSIIKLANLPLISTSANKHGAPPYLDAKTIEEHLGHEVNLIIDGGRSRVKASTVINLSRTPPLIERAGPITREMMERVIGLIK